MRTVIICLMLLTMLSVFSGKVLAIVDPLSVSNNKVGIHIISPGFEEIRGAAELANTSGGDWGYITVVIQSNDRNKGKWQTFFDSLRKYHLIPIIRIAGAPVDSYWDRPKEEDSQIWAEFLNSLNWPTKNRYVVIYNEPNHASEWGGSVDPVSYAKELDITIDMLKQASEDFFVLNGGLDASAPHLPPQYYDEERFLIEMDRTIPGIFNKLDGWVSHSYPNPGFRGSPTDFGRGTIRTFLWEKNLINRITRGRELPIFITETGWKHSEGIEQERTLPSSATVGEYFKTAFQAAWSDPGVVAVTPFLLTYQQPPFDHFSFKKFDKNMEKEELTAQVLGETTDSYYPQYQMLSKIPKTTGRPRQIHLAELLDNQSFPALVEGESYEFDLIFKNLGQSIWNENEPVAVKVLDKQQGLTIQSNGILGNKQVEPQNSAVFPIKIKAEKTGSYKIILNLFYNDQQFDSEPFTFDINVRQPVILQIKSELWGKSNLAGSYSLNDQQIELDGIGLSKEIEARKLFPDREYQFTLKREFYRPKTIKMTVNSGVNILDFGSLVPDLPVILFQPRALWSILPFN